MLFRYLLHELEPRVQLDSFTALISILQELNILDITYLLYPLAITKHLIKAFILFLNLVNKVLNLINFLKVCGLRILHVI